MRIEIGRYGSRSTFRWIGDKLKDTTWEDLATGSVWQLGDKLSERTNLQYSFETDLLEVAEAVAVYKCTDVSPNRAPDAIMKIRYGKEWFTQAIVLRLPKANADCGRTGCSKYRKPLSTSGRNQHYRQ